MPEAPWATLGLTLGALLAASPAAAAANLEPSVNSHTALNSAEGERSPAELELALGWVNRPASGSGVEYKPGARLDGAARINLVDWLGLRLQAGYETHSVGIADGALGVPGAVHQPDVSGMRLATGVIPRFSVAPRWAVGGGAGLAWARFVAPALTAERVDLVVPERVGVLLELPVSAHILWYLSPGQVALSLEGEVGFVLPGATGSLFSGAGEGTQALQKDTGELVSVDGLSPFSHSTSLQLRLHLLL